MLSSNYRFFIVLCNGDVEHNAKLLIERMNAIKDIEIEPIKIWDFLLHTQREFTKEQSKEQGVTSELKNAVEKGIENFIDEEPIAYVFDEEFLYTETEIKLEKDEENLKKKEDVLDKLKKSSSFKGTSKKSNKGGD
ncbi:MAG: hypothetical protein FWF57_01445 [Defluviitaleaceae bacterium]|nr:hypothetical protein [Defluviitaleaceae bacterium]